MFESLDDLIDNKDLNIVLNYKYYEELLPQLDNNRYLIEFIRRSKHYQGKSRIFSDNIEMLQSETLIEQIIKGKTVYMAVSNGINNYFNKYEKRNENLFISPIKLLPLQSVYLMTKSNNKFLNIFIFM